MENLKKMFFPSDERKKYIQKAAAVCPDGNEK
jgi:hypothetical protein